MLTYLYSRKVTLFSTILPIIRAPGDSIIDIGKNLGLTTSNIINLSLNISPFQFSDSTKLQIQSFVHSGAASAFIMNSLPIEISVSTKIINIALIGIASSLITEKIEQTVSQSIEQRIIKTIELMPCSQHTKTTQQDYNIHNQNLCLEHSNEFTQTQGYTFDIPQTITQFIAESSALASLAAIGLSQVSQTYGLEIAIISAIGVYAVHQSDTEGKLGQLLNGKWDILFE